MVRPGDPIQDVAVDKAPCEADPHPHAGGRIRVEVLRHPVVEGPVQVGQRDVDRHARDGQRRRRAPLAPVAHRRRHAPILPGDPDRTAGPGRPARQAPAAAFSASARSVLSQGSSTSVRPKCPYAAVWA